MENSFSAYRDQSEIITSDDEVIASSLSSSNSNDGRKKKSVKSRSVLQKSEVVVESSGDSEDESIIRAKPKRKFRVLSDSESDESLDGSLQKAESSSNSRGELESQDSVEEDEEKAVFSPRTRRSIGGYRLSITDDESSDERKTETESPSKGLFSSFDQLPTTSKTDLPTTSKTDLPNESESIREKPGRLTQHFNTSITTKMSSTIKTNAVLNNSDNFSETSSNPSIDGTPPGNTSPIEISSGSDTINITSTPLGQSNQNAEPQIVDLSAESNTEIKNVSQAEYDRALRQLSDLKHELSTCESVAKNLHSQLPDKGKRMSYRTKNLRSEIKKMTEYIVTLRVDKSLSKQKKSIEIVQPKIITWEELDTGADSVQPKFTGKIGMGNFVAQKALTLDRLKDIHGSIESCPNEDMLADEPKYLTVSLMNHQRHALAWMYWREKQRPRGGILADDMGLGKTLTMISLVLATNQREEQSESEGENDSEEDQATGDVWMRKGKRNYPWGGTLVVCPASLIRQWESEVENRVRRNKLVISVYHGSNRETRPRNLAKPDIVVTTYNIVSRENKVKGCLFGVKWDRIILDEAHVVRNHKSQASEGVCRLKGRKRWALTGTPIQNKEMDLYALLKFLRCTPFDVLSHYKQWIDNKNAGGQLRLNTLINSLMLRRTKHQLQQNGALSLPEKAYELITLQLNQDEKVVYQKVLLYSRNLFASYLQQRAENNNDFLYRSEGDKPTFLQNKHPNEAYLQAHQRFARLGRKNTEGAQVKTHEIFVLLLRLRQICCHTGLIDAMLEDDDNNSISDDNVSNIDLLEQINRLQLNDNPAASVNSFDESKENAISKALSKVLMKTNPVFNLKRISSKMGKVIEVLETRILNTNDKALIVSQWTSFLDLLRVYLVEKRVPHSSLNGTVPPAARNDIVKDFNEPNSKTKILLLSLTAGGVGLNLIGANHLLLIDLHWNPQLEAQAQDRIYRVGQIKNVTIYKFMVEETVEENIKKLQDRKLEIANGVLTGAKANAGSKLTMDDLKGIFGV